MSAFANLGSSNAGASGSSNTGLFGAKPANGGGLFGAPAAGTTPATTGGAFGNLGGAAPAGSVFGSTGTTGTSAPTSLFGSGSNSNTTAPATTNIFGNQPPAPPSTTPAGTSPFGTTSATTPGAAPTGLFGASSATTTAPAPATTNPLFGGFTKPADTNATSAAKPAGTSLFGQPSAPTGTTAAAAPPAGGFFSQYAKSDAASSASSSTAPPAAPPATTGGLFGGGGLFGAKPPATQPAAAATAAPSTATPAAPPKGLDFFPNMGAKPAEKDATSIATPGAPAAGGLFGVKPADPKDATVPAAPSLGGLFGKPAERSASTTPAPSFGSTTAAAPAAPTGLSVAVAPPSTLKGKTIEEIVNKWSTDLETHVKEFNKFAGEVAVWDRALIENSNTLAALYSHVEAAERDQNDIDQSLDHIEQQQTELASTLIAYEKVAQEILGSQGGGMRALDTGPADTERDKNYMLATDLHTHLDDLSGSLTQMIDSVNALSLPSIDSSPAEDPMAQIAQILSSHLESLQWIDGAVGDVEGKITEVEHRVKENGHTLPSSGQKSNRAFGLNR
ncbi:hypothetical protein DXG01_007967 [Tephrocybe rancida]|nr:hypothetical protein DXG01_007967 [Tephrocybe rancida]